MWVIRYPQLELCFLDFRLRKYFRTAFQRNLLAYMIALRKKIRRDRPTFLPSLSLLVCHFLDIQGP